MSTGSSPSGTWSPASSPSLFYKFVGEISVRILRLRMVEDKGKKAKVSKREGDEENEQIDGEYMLSIEKLQELQVQLDWVNEEVSDKALEVEKIYKVIHRPVYKRKNEIIQSIPYLWLTVFLSYSALGDLLTEEDQKIFKYLYSLDVEDSKDVKSSYTNTFQFSINPYFKDTMLAKAYTFKNKGSIDITRTTIKWKEGMDIDNGVKHEKKEKK